MKRINLMNAVHGMGVMTSDIVKLALISEPQCNKREKAHSVADSIIFLEQHKEYCTSFVELVWNDARKVYGMTEEERKKAEDAWECLHANGVFSMLFRKYLREKEDVNEKKAKEIYRILKENHDAYVKSNRKERFLERFSRIAYTEFLYYYTIDRDLFTMNALKNGDAPTNDSERFFTKEYIESIRQKMTSAQAIENSELLGLKGIFLEHEKAINNYIAANPKLRKNDKVPTRTRALMWHLDPVTAEKCRIPLEKISNDSRDKTTYKDVIYGELKKYNPTLQKLPI